VLNTKQKNFDSFVKSWQWVSASWVNKFGWVTGQCPSPVDPFYIVLIWYPTWFCASWKTSNGNRNCYFDCLLVPFHNLCNSVARDEQATSETHRFPSEDPNSDEILGKINWCELNLLCTYGGGGVGTVWNQNRIDTSLSVGYANVTLWQWLASSCESWVNWLMGHVGHGS